MVCMRIVCVCVVWFASLHLKKIGVNLMKRQPTKLFSIHGIKYSCVMTTIKQKQTDDCINATQCLTAIAIRALRAEFSWDERKILACNGGGGGGGGNGDVYKSLNYHINTIQWPRLHVCITPRCLYLSSDGYPLAWIIVWCHYFDVI